MNDAAIHANEAEQAVLGGLLLNNNAIEHMGDLHPHHFFGPQNRHVYAQLLTIIGEGGTADVLTVFDRMGGRSTETLKYLNDLSRNTPGYSNIGHYAEIVRDRAQRRGILDLASNLAEKARDSIGEPASKLIDHAQTQLEKLAASKTGSEPQLAADGLLFFIEDLEAQAAGTAPRAISTGFYDLDRKMSGGMRRGELIVVAARPKMGKSAFAFNVANHVAREGNSLVLSMEMPKQQIHQRNVASLGKVAMGYLLQAHTIPPEKQGGDEIWSAITNGLEALRELNLWVDDQGGLTLLDVRTKARQVKRKKGLDLLVIDYLQLMSGEGDNRNAQIESITRGLKALAKELDIAIMLLSQLNRQLENRPDKRPMPSDLRDSGAIEQDCDAALFLYRDEVYNANSPERGTAEVNVGLIRQGEPGRVRLAYIGEQTRFESLSRDWAPAPSPDMQVQRKTRGFQE